MITVGSFVYRSQNTTKMGKVLELVKLTEQNMIFETGDEVDGAIVRWVTGEVTSISLNKIKDYSLLISEYERKASFHKSQINKFNQKYPSV